MKTKKITLTTSEIIAAIDSDEMTVDEILECVIRTPMNSCEIFNTANWFADGGKKEDYIGEIVEKFKNRFGIILSLDEKIGIYNDLAELAIEYARDDDEEV